MTRDIVAVTGGRVRDALVRRRAWPLWIWAAAAAIAMGVIVTGGCAVGLALAGRLSGNEAAVCFGTGALGTIVAAVGAAFAADNAAGALRDISTEIVSALREPEARRRRRRSGVRRTAEMADLDAVVEALALRMRVADELAHRSRFTADTASAGMFELLSGTIAAEETARGQLSAELHDTVAQSLAVARTMLADGAADRALDALAEAEDQVRSLMARTRPPVLHGGDLGGAVAALRDELAQRYGLRTALEWPAQPRPLPMATAVTCYRFFGEALLNVVKHADVEDARAGLYFESAQVIAWVADQGAGFLPAQVRPERGRHVGLGLLRERVRLAGGELDVHASPGTGTRLQMALPWAPPPEPPTDSALSDPRDAGRVGPRTPVAART